MPRIPNPSVEAMLEDAPAVCGSVSRCIDELIRIVKEYAPGVVTAKNLEMNWTGSQVMKAPSDVTYALTDTSKFKKDTLYIGCQVDTDDFGVGVFKSEVTLTFFWIADAPLNAQDMRIHLVKAEVLQTILYQFLRGVIPEGETVSLWNQLRPRGYSIMNDWPDDSGTQINFEMTLTPRSG